MKMMNSYILIEPINEETTTKAGIILSVDKPVRTNKAKVISAEDDSLTGKTIVYDKYNVIDINDNRVVIKTEDIIGVEE